MRVLFVSSSYPFHRADFHALFVHDMARAFAERGDDVRVITPATPDTVDDDEVWDGVHVSRVRYPLLSHAPVTGGQGLLENLKRHPARAPVLAALFASLANAVRRQRQFDLVVAHWLVPSGLAVALAGARACRRPPVFLAHSSDVHLLGRVPGGARITRLMRRSGTIVATSDFLASRLRELGLEERAPVVELGVRLPRDIERSRHGRLRICAMGRLLHNKGFAELVRAVAVVDDVELSIAGSGPFAQELAQLIDRLGLRARARLVGAVIDDAKTRFLAEHDVFAFVPPPPERTAFQDNMPVVVLEALAHGLPVVATPVGALRDVACDAVTLCDGSPASIARALNGCKTSSTAVSASARAFAAERSWTRCIDAIEAIAQR